VQAAKAVLSQLKRLARALWSNPPTHGARIAAEVVGDAGMFEQWKGEVRHLCTHTVVASKAVKCTSCLCPT
jgi:aspartate/tyrosine/aromatic aminotransferase